MKKDVFVKLVVLCLAVVFAFAATPAIGAEKMKPLPDGFPKQAITIINIDDPGTRDGIYARMLQTHAKDICPVPIRVSDEPVAQGGTWMKVNELKTRAGALEGYYPMVIAAYGVVTDLQVEPATKEIGMKLSDMKMIMVTEQICYIWCQRKDAPWGKTFEAMIKYGKEHPGELKYVSYEVGSGHDIAAEMILAKYGVKVKKIPQSTMQECASAVGAGQADFTVIGADTALTNWQAGRIDATMAIGNTVPAPWDKDKNIVAGKDLGIPDFVGTILGLGVNSEVPQAHIDWLYKLFKAAADTPEFQKRWTGMIPGNVAKPMTGPEADKMNAEIIKAMDAPIRSVGMHIDQIKPKK